MVTRIIIQHDNDNLKVKPPRWYCHGKEFEFTPNKAKNIVYNLVNLGFVAKVKRTNFPSMDDYITITICDR